MKTEALFFFVVLSSVQGDCFSMTTRSMRDLETLNAQLDQTKWLEGVLRNQSGIVEAAQQRFDCGKSEFTLAEESAFRGCVDSIHYLKKLRSAHREWLAFYCELMGEYAYLGRPPADLWQTERDKQVKRLQEIRFQLGCYKEMAEFDQKILKAWAALQPHGEGTVPDLFEVQDLPTVLTAAAQWACKLLGIAMGGESPQGATLEVCLDCAAAMAKEVFCMSANLEKPCCYELLLPAFEKAAESNNPIISSVAKEVIKTLKPDKPHWLMAALMREWKRLNR